MTAALPSLAHKFTDAAIVWERCSGGMVLARFCTVKIGAYFTAPAETHVGMLVRFGETRFDPYAKDEAEARAWIEAAFVEWLRQAAPRSHCKCGVAIVSRCGGCLAVFGGDVLNPCPTCKQPHLVTWFGRDLAEEHACNGLVPQP